MAAKKKIILVDDHPVMRLGLEQLIIAEKDLEVIAQAGSADEALVAIEKKMPDLAIVDVTLPDKNGLELVKDLRSMYEDVAILMVSMHDENLYAERALRAGARGYIMKEAAAESLIEAIRAVLGGGVFVSKAMSKRIVEIFSGKSPSIAASPLEKLTDRELEVFELIGNGLGSKEIAGKLHVSPRTIDAHRAHIKEKLHLRDAHDLIRHAVKWVESR